MVLCADLQPVTKLSYNNAGRELLQEKKSYKISLIREKS